MSNNVEIRFADRADTGLILEFIKELAAYEQLSGEVVADEKLLEEWIFDKGKAEVLICNCQGEPAGFALFFHNFSTFLGRAGIYLEDLFVKARFRKLGLGKLLLQRLAQITLERGCGRLEWYCLDWNQPSIDFYLALGAEPLDSWTTYRLTGRTLADLAGSSADAEIKAPSDNG